MHKFPIKMETVPPKQKKLKSATAEELLKLSQNDLVEIVLQLKAHNLQLKNIISKSLSGTSESLKNERKKPFDFDKCHYRPILLRILYLGWDYQGLAMQEDTTQTVEHYVFHALIKSCLIRNRETSRYHRCGRTDKGVSSTGQVISITVRSKYATERQTLQECIETEISYCKILNRLLPKEIRAVCWTPLPDDRPDFSARFDCKKRQYRYYFPHSNLKLAAMRAACSHLIGSHDFRNLCKMDVGNGVTQFRREIFRADILPVDEKDFNNPTSMHYLIIEGNAFLWHQIRCIVGVLIVIGQGLEEPEVVAKLLDVNSYPRKPQYNMALDIPLNLFHCTYDIDDSKWFYEKEELMCTIKHFQSEWTLHSIKSTMIQDALQQLEEQYAKLASEAETGDTENNGREGNRIICQAECLIQGVKPRVYTPLLKREKCSSLEEKIEHYRKKRKIESTVT